MTASPVTPACTATVARVRRNPCGPIIEVFAIRGLQQISLQVVDAAGNHGSDTVTIPVQ